jgi:hypothetical protein
MGSCSFLTICLFRAELGDLDIGETNWPAYDLAAAKAWTRERLIAQSNRADIAEDARPRLATIHDEEGRVLATFALENVSPAPSGCTVQSVGTQPDVSAQELHGGH